MLDPCPGWQHSLSQVVKLPRRERLVSNRWIQFTGNPNLAATWEDHVHPEDWPNCNQTWEEALDNQERCVVEYRVRGANGVYRNFLTDLMPLTEEKYLGINGTSIDVTFRETENKETIERFICRWQNEPVAFNHFVGRAIGRIGYKYLYELYLAIGASYFSLMSICERIDFIYDRFLINTILKFDKKSVVRLTQEKGIICITDVPGNHDGVSVMLIRDCLDGLPYYSLRYYEPTLRLTDWGLGSKYLQEHWDEVLGKPSFRTVLADIDSKNPQYEVDHVFWNFRKPKDCIEGVIVYPHSDGFEDVHESKSLANLIVIASNLLGY